MSASAFLSTYGIWLLTCVAEAAVAWWLRGREDAPSRAIVLYLKCQLGMSALLFAAGPVLLNSEHLYMRAYELDVVLGSITHWLIVFAILWHLAGHVRAFGNPRSWLLATVVAGVALCALASLAFPPALNSGWRLILSLEHYLDRALLVGILGTAFYGWVAASSWPRCARMAWNGLALKVAAAAIFEQINLMNGFHLQTGWASHFNDVVFALNLLLWYRVRVRSARSHSVTNIPLPEVQTS